MFLAALTLALPCHAETPRGAELDTKELRALLREITAEHDAGARGQLVARGLELAGDAPMTELIATIRKGPSYPTGLPAPRVVAGATEELVPIEFSSGAAKLNVQYGYTVEFRGETYRYCVDVPSGYDPGRPTPLLIDPGHGSGVDENDTGKADFLKYYRQHADRSGHRDWLHARTEILERTVSAGHRTSMSEVDIVLVYRKFLRDVCSLYNVDPDRIYLPGMSQTGYWAWNVGNRAADRFAGLGPIATGSRHVDASVANFLNVPVYCIHGDLDDVAPVDSPRKTMRLLAALGANTVYHEVAGGRHNSKTWRNLTFGLEWLGEQSRQAYPRRVSKSVENVGHGWCYWLRVDELDSSRGGVDAEIEGQRIELFSDGVSKVTLALAGEMLDLDLPVEVLWNGQQVHVGVVARDKRATLELFAETHDWRRTFEAALPLALPR